MKNIPVIPQRWQRRLSGALVVGLVSIVLSACATDQAAEAPVATTSVAEAETESVAALNVPPPEPEPEPPTPVPDPATIVGYSEAALEDLFGEPSFTRRDPPAELWQYRNDHCTLDLFLYENTNGAYSVEHLEFRETEPSSENHEHCLRLIIERRLAETSAS